MKCSFCNKEIGPGTGKMFVRKTGKILYFCFSKCEKNFNLGRNPAKVKWVRKSKKAKNDGKNRNIGEA